MEGRITTWSYSKLEVFEKCAFQAFLKYVQKVPEGESAVRDKALKKGRDTHDLAEGYVKGTVDLLPKGLRKFEKQFDEAKAGYAFEPEAYEIEQDWGFTIDWAQTGYYDDDVWFRAKLDYLQWLDPDKTAAHGKDYKTGRKDGNEVKHSQQMQLYVVSTFMRHQALQALKFSFEYLDHGKTTTRSYSRDQAMAFLPAFDRRGKALTEATRFPPKPSRIACRWCPFGPNKGNGECEYGVEV
jgi:hypothetical protein